MNFLQDCITYVRRNIKTMSNSEITDSLIIDYINRFCINVVNLKMELFDFKTTYKFVTTPFVDRYNMPLYSTQTYPDGSEISFYPVYQGFLPACSINGTPVNFFTEKSNFFNLWSSQVNMQTQVATGDGSSGPYTFTLPYSPSIRAHVDMTGIIATGQNIDPPVVSDFNSNIPVTSVDPKVYITSIDATGANIVACDSGQFLQGSVNHGLLMTPGAAPFGNTALPGGYSTTSNTVNYITGEVTVTFPVAVPQGTAINAQCNHYQPGLPRAILFYNNTLYLRCPPDQAYQVEIDAYMTPAAYLTSPQAMAFGYMVEYIAYGASIQILADTGDWELHDRYKMILQEKEALVHIRSERIKTATRTQSYPYSTGAWGGNNINGYRY